MKNKVMGLLALASCVMLSGCGDDKKEVKIEIAEFPTNLVEGDTIDLKDYIAVSGGTGSYSVNFDDDSFSKIELKSETEIQLLEYGTVSFTVDYSGKTADGSILVSSALLNRFLNDTANAGYDYTTVGLDDQFYFNSFVNYDEKFCIDWMLGDDYAGGYLEGKDGKVYSYTLDEEGEFGFSITGYEPEKISDYCKPLWFPRTGYEITEGLIFEDKCISLKENENLDVKRIINDFFHFSDDILDYYGIEPSLIEIYEEVIPLDKDYPGYFVVAFGNDADGLALLDYTLLSTEKDLVDKDYVLEYIRDDGQPKSSYSLDIDDIATAVNKHDYTIHYDYGWYDCTLDEDGNYVRGDKRDNNPFTKDLDVTGAYIPEFLNALGEFDVYVGKNKTFSDVKHKDGYGLINDSNTQAWKYSGNDSDGYKAYENTEAPLYDPDFDFIYENYQFLNGCEIDEYPSVYEEIFINSCSVDTDGNYVFSFSGITATDLFDCLFLESVHDGIYPPSDPSVPDDEAYIIGKFNSANIVAEFLLDEDMVKYLNGTIVEKYNAGVLVGLTVEFVWEDSEDEYEGPFYQYVMSCDIDFTECVMPEFDVTFPTTK